MDEYWNFNSLGIILDFWFSDTEMKKHEFSSFEGKEKASQQKGVKKTG